MTDRTGSTGSTPRRHWTHLPEHLGLKVSEGAVPDVLPGAERPWDWIEITPDSALVHFDHGAGLLVRNGREVLVQWPAESDPAGDPSWILQGWAVTLASLQRGNLSLHAATVQIGETLVAIAGGQGAGKSTTAMALRRRGHQLLVDDVTLLEFRGTEVWTTPYSRNVHLLPDAAEALGLDFHLLPLLAGGRKKAAFRAEEPSIDPRPVDLVVVLNADGGTDEAPRLEELRGSARFTALIEHTNRDGLAPMVLGQEAYFRQLAQLADAAPIVELHRPHGQPSLEAVADLIEGTARSHSGTGERRL